MFFAEASLKPRHPVRVKRESSPTGNANDSDRILVPEGPGTPLTEVGHEAGQGH